MSLSTSWVSGGLLRVLTTNGHAAGETAESVAARHAADLAAAQMAFPPRPTAIAERAYDLRAAATMFGVPLEAADKVAETATDATPADAK